MTQKTDFVSANLPLLEGYFLAPDRNKYLSSLQ